MVVASRRAWVDPQHLLRILQEDGYRQLPNAAQADLGDVVVYQDERGEVCHVGTVVRKKVVASATERDSLVVLSKWGADGEYIHDATAVPFLLGKPAEYWTDRMEHRP